jgi:hypothetical protein
MECLLHVTALLILLLSAVEGTGDIIRSNFDTTSAHWNDTNGDRIEAHAAGMLYSKTDSYWYWYGESKKTNSLSTHGVNCYRSTSLAGPWEFVGQVLSQNDVSVKDLPPPYVIERPKVLFNEMTKKFVMWFHLDDSKYKYRHSGVATSVKPEGPFHFEYALQPDGIPSLDMNLWRDPLDNKAYFIRSCDNQYAGISEMTNDYMNTTGLISKHDRFEGMALFRLKNGTVYLIASHLTGWNPNPLMLFRNDGASMSESAWTLLGNPTHQAQSFNTQPTYVVSQNDQNGNEYFIYLSDNWINDGGLINAGYVWLPFWFEQDAVVLKKQSAWNLKHPFLTTANTSISTSTSTVKNASPQRVIVDTDMGFDVDDVVAVCLANSLHMNSKINLLAVVHNTGCNLGIGGVSSINHWYNHDNVTLGAWKGMCFCRQILFHIPCTLKW